MKKTIISMVMLMAGLTAMAQEGADRLTSAYQKVAFSLFNEVLKTADDNVCFSPLSAQLALCMMQNGANGNTLQEMQSALGTEGFSTDDVNKYNQTMSQQLTYRPEFQFNAHEGLTEQEAKDLHDFLYPTCEIANALWNRPGVTIYKSFSDVLRQYYDAGTGAVDFSTQEGINYVNGWVDEKTHGLIKGIFSEPQSDDLAVVLVNALYLKAAWAVPFWEQLTKEEAFYLTDGTSTQTDMMFVSDPAFILTETGPFRCVTLPYNNLFSMTVFVPVEGFELPAISYENWKESAGKRIYDNEVGVNLKFPKFDISGIYNLIPVLKTLGMTEAFTSSADFSRLSDVNRPISAVYQLSRIKVDEKCTEAAAVTAIEATESADPEKVVDFFVDRPFYFTIQNQRTNTILFMGKVTKPGASTSGEATKISKTTTKKEEEMIYDLCGRPLQRIPEHGIFIQNGRKIIR